MNTMMLLEMAASGFGDRVAFTNPETNTSITYQELFDAAGAAAVTLEAVIIDTRQKATKHEICRIMLFPSTCQFVRPVAIYL